MGKEAVVVVEAPEHHPLDQVAKELSNPTVSRRRALKLMVGALVGGAGLALIPGVAAAAPPQHSRAGGRFGSLDTCGNQICDPANDDRDCPAGCLCAFPHSGGAYYTCTAPRQAAPPEHAQDKTGFGAGGRFGQGGPPHSGSCTGTCDRDSDCGGGCRCACTQWRNNFPFSICC